jgi:hypothetical protein
MRMVNSTMASVWHTGQVFQSMSMNLLVITNLQLTKDKMKLQGRPAEKDHSFLHFFC